MNIERCFTVQATVSKVKKADYFKFCCRIRVSGTGAVDS